MSMTWYGLVYHYDGRDVTKVIHAAIAYDTLEEAQNTLDHISIVTVAERYDIVRFVERDPDFIRTRTSDAALEHGAYLVLTMPQKFDGVWQAVSAYSPQDLDKAVEAAERIYLDYNYMAYRIAAVEWVAV